MKLRFLFRNIYKGRGIEYDNRKKSTPSENSFFHRSFITDLSRKFLQSQLSTLLIFATNDRVMAFEHARKRVDPLHRSTET